MAGMQQPLGLQQLVEILIVGSSRVRDLLWRRYPGFRITLVSHGGMTHQQLIRTVDRKLTEDENKTIKILICVGLQVELHSRVTNKRRSGFVYANPTPPISDIVRDLNSADYRWRTGNGLTVLWVAPYTPDLLVLNLVVKKIRKWGNHLLPQEVECAEEWMSLIQQNREKLLVRMRANNLLVHELALLPHHLTRANGSDGLHLGDDSKRTLFGHAIEAAINLYREGPPMPNHIGIQLSAEERVGANAFRRQKRKIQKTRAAERAVFQAAAEEQQDQAAGPSKRGKPAVSTKK